MRKLREIGATGFEVEVLFRRVLNMQQIHYISWVLRSLGKYMVLDRDMIAARMGKKVGLSYLQKAKEYGLIAEYKYKDGEEEKNKYYFSLAPGGLYFLEAEQYAHHKLRLDADHEERTRILTFNRFALDNGYDINMGFQQDRRYRFYFAQSRKGNKTPACYHPEVIKEEQLREILLQMLNRHSKKEKEKPELPPEAVDESFDLIPIKADTREEFGRNSEPVDLGGVYDEDIPG